MMARRNRIAVIIRTRAGSFDCIGNQTSIAPGKRGQGLPAAIGLRVVAVVEVLVVVLIG